MGRPAEEGRLFGRLSFTIYSLMSFTEDLHKNLALRAKVPEIVQTKLRSTSVTVP